MHCSSRRRLGTTLAERSGNWIGLKVRVLLPTRFGYTGFGLSSGELVWRGLQADGAAFEVSEAQRSRSSVPFRRARWTSNTRSTTRPRSSVERSLSSRSTSLSVSSRERVFRGKPLGATTKRLRRRRDACSRTSSARARGTTSQVTERARTRPDASLPVTEPDRAHATCRGFRPLGFRRRKSARSAPSWNRPQEPARALLVARARIVATQSQFSHALVATALRCQKTAEVRGRPAEPRRDPAGKGHFQRLWPAGCRPGLRSPSASRRCSAWIR